MGGTGRRVWQAMYFAEPSRKSLSLRRVKYLGRLKNRGDPRNALEIFATRRAMENLRQA